jgi:lipopolysaccharide export system protein LptA
MRRRPSVALALVLATARAIGAQAPETPPADATGAKPAEAKPAGKAPGGFLDMGGGRKDPITITSDNLVYEYKDGVIVYRGDVLAVQGDVKIRSNELRITLAKSGKDAGAEEAGGATLASASSSKLDAVVASGNVRIDQGTRWAVGGKATFDQKNRTLVLTESPVLHDGPNEVAGDRVVVYLDEDRSVVEGGRRRVKAVLFPDNDDAGAKKGAAAKAPKPPGPAR